MHTGRAHRGVACGRASRARRKGKGMHTGWREQHLPERAGRGAGAAGETCTEIAPRFVWRDCAETRDCAEIVPRSCRQVAELSERKEQQKLLGKAEAAHWLRGEEVPIGLGAMDVAQLKQHLQNRERTPKQADLPDEQPPPKDPDEAKAE